MLFRRVKPEGFGGVGRSFMGGDLVVIDTKCDKLVHLYSSLDDDGVNRVHSITSPLSNLSPDSRKKLEDNTEEYEGL